MVFLQNVIYYIYMAFAAISGFFLVKQLFKREKHKGIVNDIIYAYCIIPFLLRILQIK
ncbi:MAG: hypothetical protein MRZ54_04920 [Clostridiales bacterium]|nr:hypothetical protein [Clostridiales bacterium]